MTVERATIHYFLSAINRGVLGLMIYYFGLKKELVDVEVFIDAQSMPLKLPRLQSIRGDDSNGSHST